jgi:hypothetical protein
MEGGRWRKEDEGRKMEEGHTAEGLGRKEGRR